MKPTEERKVFKRQTSFWRVWSLEGLEVDNLIFYADGKILYSSSRGWLEDETSGQDLTQMDIKKPVRAIKEDLTRKDNFYIKGRREYKFDKGYNFYINVDLENIQIEEAGEELYFENDNEISKKHFFKISFVYPCLRYEPYLDEKKELQYNEIETSEIKVIKKWETIRKEQGKQAEEIAEKFNKLGFKCSHYDIERILDKYNLSLIEK